MSEIDDLENQDPLSESELDELERRLTRDDPRLRHHTRQLRSDGGWKRIETAPKDGTFIYLLAPSGYVTTPYRVEIGRWVPGFRDWWITIDNDAFESGGAPPTHWRPRLPDPKG